jgi:hypothetical protein
VEEPLAPVLHLVPPLARDHEHAVLHLDLHLLGAQPGQVGAHHELVAALEQLDLRRERPRPAGAATELAGRARREAEPPARPRAARARRERRRSAAPADVSNTRSISRVIASANSNGFAMNALAISPGLAMKAGRSEPDCRSPGIAPRCCATCRSADPAVPSPGCTPVGPPSRLTSSGRA